MPTVSLLLALLSTPAQATCGPVCYETADVWLDGACGETADLMYDYHYGDCGGCTCAETLGAPMPGDTCVAAEPTGTDTSATGDTSTSDTGTGLRRCVFVADVCVDLDTCVGGGSFYSTDDDDDDNVEEKGCLGCQSGTSGGGAGLLLAMALVRRRRRLPLPL